MLILWMKYFYHWDGSITHDLISQKVIECFVTVMNLLKEIIKTNNLASY